MQRATQLKLLSVSTLFIAACANTDLSLPTELPHVGDLPFVHKIDIQQGNVITQEMLAQLQPGMDKKKVNFIMGSPIILDTFHKDRWDYVYTFQPGGRRAERRRVTLYFKEDKLDHLTGNIKPAEGRLIVDMRQDKSVEVPKAPEWGLVAKLKNSLPLIGEKDTESKKKKDKNAVAAAEDDLPNTDVPPPLKPGLTPIERAAREEEGGPGVLTKLEAALPFSKKNKERDTIEGDAKSTLAAADKSPSTTKEDETSKDDDAANNASNDESKPGLMKRLKNALPFSHDQESAASNITPVDADKKTTANASSVDKSQDRSIEVEEGKTEDVPITVPTPAPAVPESTELDQEIAPTEVESSDQQKNHNVKEVTVPDGSLNKKKPGFFARLFGSDSSSDEPTKSDKSDQRDNQDSSSSDKK